MPFVFPRAGISGSVTLYIRTSSIPFPLPRRVAAPTTTPTLKTQQQNNKITLFQTPQLQRQGKTHSPNLILFTRRHDARAFNFHATCGSLSPSVSSAFPPFNVIPIRSSGNSNNNSFGSACWQSYRHASSSSVPRDNHTPQTAAAEEEGGGNGDTRMRSIAARRRSTKSLYEKDSGREMHSNLLSEHPLKIKYDAQRLSAVQARVAEEAYRDRSDAKKQRKAAELTAELEGFHRTVAFHRTKEYKWYIVSALSGHLLSSYLVYNYFYAEDARLEYDPVSGYVDDLRRKKEEMVVEDAYINGHGVLSHFVDKRK